MAIFKKSLAGPGYIILNVLRAANIVSLLTVMTASMVMLVKTFIVSQFYFFDGVSHVITFSLGIFLVASEIGIFRNYFMRSWPLLGHEHGLVTLGILMIITGVSILGNLNKEATSQKSLGMNFWQIVISSGILTIIMGVANIISNYVFRQKSLHVTARMVRAYGAVAPQKVNDTLAVDPNVSSPSVLNRSFHSPSMRSPSMAQRNPPPTSSIYSQSVRASFRSFSAPMPRRDGLPSYHAPEAGMQRSNTSVSAASTVRVPAGLNISSPIDENPAQFAKFKGSEDVRRPDPAAHPALQGGRF